MKPKARIVTIIIKEKKGDGDSSSSSMYKSYDRGPINFKTKNK